ncbi:hypothetical protein [Klenkia brasiliensis]|uniref:Uncharacterized protein n=1 Tax=Klenkia brasiliensis TaxID=333142 RepID=A0A1G7LCY5_9ACTN|nr:hypothetical protein [Klenkia brasiliensis]SDF47333.1 hypothetical protein SAMN05660324_0218 [Klenkia brasiliensis]
MTGSDHWWVGVPAQAADAHLLADLDAALTGSGRRAVWVQTHVDRTGPAPVVTASWQLDDGPAVPAARFAGPFGDTARPVDGAPVDGRAVRFPGSDAVSARLTVAELLASTAVDRVVGIGAPAGPGDVLDTVDGYLRPVRHPDGVELLVDPAGPGTWRPVEISSPHECCGGHG